MALKITKYCKKSVFSVLRLNVDGVAVLVPGGSSNLGTHPKLNLSVTAMLSPHTL